MTAGLLAEPGPGLPVSPPPPPIRLRIKPWQLPNNRDPFYFHRSLTRSLSSSERKLSSFQPPLCGVWCGVYSLDRRKSSHVYDGRLVVSPTPLPQGVLNKSIYYRSRQTVPPQRGLDGNRRRAPPSSRRTSRRASGPSRSSTSDQGPRDGTTGRFLSQVGLHPRPPPLALWVGGLATRAPLFPAVVLLTHFLWCLGSFLCLSIPS